MALWAGVGGRSTAAWWDGYGRWPSSRPLAHRSAMAMWAAEPGTTTASSSSPSPASRGNTKGWGASNPKPVRSGAHQLLERPMNCPRVSLPWQQAGEIRSGLRRGCGSKAGGRTAMSLAGASGPATRRCRRVRKLEQLRKLQTQDEAQQGGGQWLLGSPKGARSLAAQERCARAGVVAGWPKQEPRRRRCL